MKAPPPPRQPNFNDIRQSLLRQGCPERCPVMELHVDDEIASAVMGRPIDKMDPVSLLPFQVRMGYDAIPVFSDLVLPGNDVETDASAETGSLATRRAFTNEQDGPLATRERYEAFPWPDPARITFSKFAAVGPLLPDGMAILARAFGPFALTTWRMGIQPFCMALVDDRPFVEQVFARISELVIAAARGGMAQMRVGAVWISDDLGFNSGPFIAPADLRKLVFPVYAEICREARRRDLPVLLHSCGNLHTIIPDLIACGISGFHSLPPNLYDLARLKADWGDRLCFLGNIDVDLLARGSPEAVRRAVRNVKDIWRADPAGGIILSSSNSITNYCRLENYFAMMDEARK